MTLSRTLLAAVVSATVVTIFSAPAAAENWPQWRGAKLDGVSTETGIATTWAKDKNVVWRTPLPGPAGATPAIWKDRIFVSSADKNDLVLVCLDTAGKELWRKTMTVGGNRTARGDEGNAASPSPSTDGKQVYCMMGSGDIAAFDFEGKEVWKFNLQDRYGKFNIQFGMSSTPVLDGERLYLQLIHSGGAQVVALNTADGKEAWKAKRLSDARAECEHSYASPIMYRDKDREYLISHGADYAIGHSLKDGSELWRVGGLNPKGKYNNTLRLVASPVAVPGLIVVPSAKNGPVLGLKPDLSGNVTASTEAHIWKRNANTPDVPSPLVHDGLVYLCRENGVLICMDAKTGEQYYEKRTVEDRHRASPVFADGKIYVTCRDGTVTVVKAGKTFEELAKNKLGESLSASPAISEGVLYLRTFDALYAIKEK